MKVIDHAGLALEFTHFSTLKTHPTPMNKGRGAFSQVKWTFRSFA